MIKRRKEILEELKILDKAEVNSDHYKGAFRNSKYKGSDEPMAEMMSDNSQEQRAKLLKELEEIETKLFNRT